MIEIVCKVCGAHLGHKFDDAKLHNPDVEGDTRYCINGVALQFLNKTSQKQKAEEQVYQWKLSLAINSYYSNVYWETGFLSDELVRNILAE